MERVWKFPYGALAGSAPLCFRHMRSIVPTSKACRKLLLFARAIAHDSMRVPACPLLDTFEDWLPLCRLAEPGTRSREI